MKKFRKFRFNWLILKWYIVYMKYCRQRLISVALKISKNNDDFHDKFSIIIFDFLSKYSMTPLQKHWCLSCSTDNILNNGIQNFWICVAGKLLLIIFRLKKTKKVLTVALDTKMSEGDFTGATKFFKSEPKTTAYLGYSDVAEKFRFSYPVLNCYQVVVRGETPKRRWNSLNL